MGEVYAAEDTKLHRTVALKVLPPAFATDPDRRRRFEREAQTIAALNHPGIVTIYSVEVDGPVPFLTMERADGRPLRDEIAKGGMPVGSMLRSAIAIADAVAAAHQRGIVHRDLKPANVIVGPDGRVKVLDFGLAKVHDGELAQAGESSTHLPADHLTGEGRIVGTVAYMSPEQAEGKSVDQRSDIFSLGVMLHEMATGERPFRGDTEMSIISAIIKDAAPPVTDSRPDLPPQLARIVKRCLIKDPQRRYQSARDLQTDLEDLKQDIDSGVLSSPSGVGSSGAGGGRRRVPRRVAYAAASGVLILAATIAWMTIERRLSRPQMFAAGEFVRLTDSGAAHWPAISPDGRYVAYVQNDQGVPALWLRQTAAGSSVVIVPSTDGRFAGVSFSADGNFVYYALYPKGTSIATLYRVPVLGGQSLRVLDDVDSAIAFSPDGKQFSFFRGQPTEGKMTLMTASVDGSGVRPVVVAQAPRLLANVLPPWSPDGRTIAAIESGTGFADKSRLVGIDVGSGRRSPFGGEWELIVDVAWMPDGRSVIATAAESLSSTLEIWQVGWPGGERHRLTSGVNDYARLSVSADGKTIATVEDEYHANIWMQPLGEGNPRQLTQSVRGAVGGTGLDWTPAGRLVYSTYFIADSGPHLWAMDADGTHARQLTSMFAAEPAVSADGEWVYFSGGAEGASIWKLSMNGGDPIRLTTGTTDTRPLVSPDGRWVYFTSREGARNRAMKVSVDGGSATPLTEPELLFNLAAISSDGMRLFGYARNVAKRRTQAATVSTSGGAVAFIDNVPPGASPLPDGKTWLYTDSRSGTNRLFLRPVDGGDERLIVDAGQDTVTRWALSRDGRMLAFVRGRATTDVVLIKAK